MSPARHVRQEQSARLRFREYDGRTLTRIEMRDIVVTDDCFTYVDPLGQIGRPFPNLLRSCWIGQLSDHLSRCDDSAVQPLQRVDRSDEREVVERRAIRDDDGHRDEARAASESFCTSSNVTSRNTPCFFRKPSISYRD